MKTTVEKNLQSKQYISLTEMRRDECYQALMETPDKDVLQMICAHFESHPALPGEKTLKERAVYELCQLDAKALSFGDGRLSQDVKRSLARQYADTRIREFPVTIFEARPDELKHQLVGEYQKNNSTVHVSSVPAELYKNDFGAICARMKKMDGEFVESVVFNESQINNPMIVKRCKAEIQCTDWSNGKMKNVSTKIVVDTDMMSGDILENGMPKSVPDAKQDVYAYSERMGKILNGDPHCEFDGDKLVVSGAGDKIMFDFGNMTESLYLYMDDTNEDIGIYDAQDILSDPKSKPHIDGAKLVVFSSESDDKVRLDLGLLSDEDILELSCDEESMDFANAVASLQTTEQAVNK